MQNEKKDILEKTAKEYFSAAEDEFKKERYNSAVVLYFKALISLSDLFILINTGKTPSSHTKRFQIAKESYPEVYNLLDKDFPFYQASYSQIMTKELAGVIKDDLQTMAKKVKIEL